MSTDQTDPFVVLGAKPEATESELRARYLELVKRFPPEQNPKEFQRIHAAYSAAKDPLVVVPHLLQPPSETPPSWTDAIEQSKAKPPAIPVKLLLAIGNRTDDEKTHRVDDLHE